MLTIKQGRKYLKDKNLTDEEIENIIKNLYSITSCIINEYLEERYGK